MTCSIKTLLSFTFFKQVKVLVLNQYWFQDTLSWTIFTIPATVKGQNNPAKMVTFLNLHFSAALKSFHYKANYEIICILLFSSSRKYIHVPSFSQICSHTVQILKAKQCCKIWNTCVVLLIFLSFQHLLVFNTMIH